MLVHPAIYSPSLTPIYFYFLWSSFIRVEIDNLNTLSEPPPPPPKNKLWNSELFKQIYLSMQSCFRSQCIVVWFFQSLVIFIKMDMSKHASERASTLLSLYFATPAKWRVVKSWYPIYCNDLDFKYECKRVFDVYICFHNVYIHCKQQQANEAASNAFDHKTTSGL